MTFHERDLEAYCNQIAEGGIAAFMSAEVSAGSVVSLQFAVPLHPAELRVQAVVRWQAGLRHGLEFTPLNEQERLAIRQFCDELPSADGVAEYADYKQRCS